MARFYSSVLFSVLLSLFPFAYGQSPPVSQYKDCFLSDLESPYIPGYLPPSGGRVGMLLVEILQNKISTLSKPYWTYTVSCPGDLNVEFLDSFPSVQIEQIEQFLRETSASYVSSKVNVTVTPLDNTSGPTMRAMFDIMNNTIIGGGARSTYRNYSANKLAKVRVRFDLQPFYFYSNFYEEDYEWTLATRNVAWVTVTNRQGLIIGSGIFPYMHSPDNSCVIDAYETIVSPATVDFGNVGKKEIESGKSFSKTFSVNVTRNKGSCGEITTSPKIYFMPQDDHDKNNIYLDNGLMMTFKDENNRQVPLAAAFNLGKVSNGQLKKTIHVELKKGTRGQEIKSGPFSSTVIYLMEYY